MFHDEKFQFFTIFKWDPCGEIPHVSPGMVGDG